MAMGIGLRSYEYFEAGRGPLTNERLQAFALATDSDYFALALGASLSSPTLAFECVDNKFIMAFVSELQAFEAELAGGVSTLEATAIFSAFGAAFRELAGHARSRAEAAAPLHDPIVMDGGPHHAPLTPRQIECLAWARDGKSSGDIGLILGISARTVDGHVAEACARLEVRTRVQAVAMATQLGYLEPSTP